MKAPHHLSLRPQYHWTTQKIRVHNFCCVIGYLLNALLYKQSRECTDYSGAMSGFLNTLDNIRLGTVIQNSGSRGRPKVQYSLESADGYALLFIKLFRLDEMLKKRPKIKGLSKY